MLVVPVPFSVESSCAVPTTCGFPSTKVLENAPLLKPLVTKLLYSLKPLMRRAALAVISVSLIGVGGKRVSTSSIISVFGPSNTPFPFKSIQNSLPSMILLSLVSANSSSLVMLVARIFPSPSTS